MESLLHLNMKNICCSALITVILFVVVNGHVVGNRNLAINNNITGNVRNNTVHSDNSTNILNTTLTTATTSTPSTEAPDSNRIYNIRERFHFRNRRYRLRRIREQILQSLGWTEPPQIPESVRRRMLNNSFHMMPMEPEVREDRRCFSASCSLPRQIDQNLWTDSSLSGYRVYTNIPSRHELSRSTLESASLNVYLTHIEGFTCHGEEVPVSRTGSRFLVSVYQFIRPLRFQRSRNRVLNRKRLIDARMVTTSGHTWVTFDVKQAVMEWISGARNNFGFEIMVRDENETECNAVDMFVDPDCQSQPETGCREDNSVIMSSLPWSRNIEGNHPYLELVSRQGRPSRGSRRLRRSEGSRSSHDSSPRHSDITAESLSAGDARDTSAESLASEEGVSFNSESTVGFCQGTEVTIDILKTVDFVIAPRYFTTLVCSGTCATTYNGMLQIAASRCRATSERRVTGLYFNRNNSIVIGELPFSQVLECGC